MWLQPDSDIFRTVPTIRSKGNDAYSVVTLATRREKPRKRFDQHTLTGPFTKAETTLLRSTNEQLPAGVLAQLVERCTGIAEVKGSNPVQAWILSGFLFATAKVASNFDDLLSYNSSTNSQTTTVKLSTGQNLIGVATMRVARTSSLSRRPVHVLRKWRKQKSNFTVVVRPSSRDNLMATFQFGIIKYWPLLVCTDGHYVEVSGAEN